GLHEIMRRTCPRGVFGYECRYRCRCLGNDQCNKVTGTCPRGCADGYWGPGCQLSCAGSHRARDVRDQSSANCTCTMSDVVLRVLYDNNRTASSPTPECSKGRLKLRLFFLQHMRNIGQETPNRCYYNGQKRNYMGTVNRTEDGYPCQGWDVQYPHEHNYQQTDFPDGRFPDNYCRTTSDSSMPWCYARTGRKRWSYCNIVNCACPAGLFGHNCAKMCHCTEKGEKCDSILGMCKSGCAVGWSGFDCQTPNARSSRRDRVATDHDSRRRSERRRATACAENKYGWSCESECKCRNSRHCDRFSGPTSECQCKQGFFNPPQCEPVTPPSIVEFSNEQVNPGQPAEFNCTVSAFPMPMESEIRLLAPEGRKVELMRSTELEYYMRKNTFRVALLEEEGGDNCSDPYIGEMRDMWDSLQCRVFCITVDYVQSDEKYSCFVQATAGTTILTAFAKVFALGVYWSASSETEIGFQSTPGLFAFFYFPARAPLGTNTSLEGHSSRDITCLTSFIGA
ncbi:hypothetical protein BaRGS_00006542, partial [Batillaria attramentaria]